MIGRTVQAEMAETIVADGPARLREAVAALPPEERRRLLERLEQWPTRPRPVRRTRLRSPLSMAVALREALARLYGDPRCYANRHDRDFGSRGWAGSTPVAMTLFRRFLDEPWTGTRPDGDLTRGR
jgi:hypothetical protein